MRSLVVFYSLTGTTRTLAGAIAQELGADIAEIFCARYGRTFIGAWNIGLDMWTGRLPEVHVETAPLSSYGLLIAGAPLWGGRAAAPIRSYLAARRGGLPRTAFFLTYGGTATERAFSGMEEAAGVSAAGRLAVKTRDVAGASCQEAVKVFAAALRASP